MNNNKQYSKQQHQQRIEDNAWPYMSLYWFFGWLIAWRMGYISRLLHSQEHRGTLITNGFPRMAAALVTVVSQIIMTRRLDNFGRKHNHLASLAFAVGNGFGETFWFLAIYDFGKSWHLTIRWFDLSQKGAALWGFWFFFIYSAMIHALFWMRVFPRHIKPHAAPFLTHGLPSLLLISIAWLGLYEFYGDILTICEIHTLMDFWFATVIALPPPNVPVVDRILVSSTFP